MVAKSCTSWWIPLFLGFQPPFWWCRISQPSTVWFPHSPWNSERLNPPTLQTWSTKLAEEQFLLRSLASKEWACDSWRCDNEGERWEPQSFYRGWEVDTWSWTSWTSLSWSWDIFQKTTRDVSWSRSKKNTTTEPQGPGLWGPWKMRLAPVRNHALAAFG